MIQRLRLSNIGLFQEKELVFNEGITMITGKNGSGKSTILSSIRWAISDNLDLPLANFRTLGDTDNESVVEIFADGLHIVKKIVPKGTRFQVNMQVSQNGVEISRPTATGYKNFIMEELQIQPWVFSNGIFMAQKSEVELLTRPSTAKTFLIRLFSLDRYTELDAKAKDELNSIDTELSTIVGKIEGLEGALIQPDDARISEVESSIAELKHDLEGKEADLSELMSLREQYKGKYAEILQHNAHRSLIVEKLKSAQEEKAAIPLVKEEDIQGLEETLQDVSGLKNEGELNLQNVVAQIHQRESAISLLTTKNVCPACRRGFTPRRRKAVKAQIEKEIAALHKNERTVSEGLAEAEEFYRGVYQKLNDAKKSQVDMRELQYQIADLESQLSTCEDTTSQLEAYAELNQLIEVELNEINSLKSEIGELTSELKRHRQIQTHWSDVSEKVALLNEKRIELAHQQEHLSILREAYGKDGIPKLILESELEALESAINSNLQILSEDEMKIEFVTNREGKEVFEVYVQHGAWWKPFLNLSSGERKRVQLACLFGLSDFVDTPIDWRAGDEIDAELDEKGIRTLKTLMLEKRNQYNQLIIASLRKELYDVADNIIEL